ncbi:MAG: DNA polymerase I [Candidatus Fischerbacteria bacterium RBG_13_37_8]|uniref:DNA polymerase I n=1 Tax=Candidatus Fischerbacteria bacterium RBG_13_37_8 TaxID=1817863 RepID=A0A1F5VGD5_9BACT|nr:MAG: DNA polymerase I [Candidatus Fischerbacteria bacterium RBG_13_37_8]
MKKIYLLDGNGLLYRAFFGLPQMTTQSGQPTNAIYGLTVILLKLLKEYEPDYVAVAFDMKGPTFRHEIYKEYKIERPPMPDALAVQWDIAKKVCQALGISTVQAEKYEADDIISSITAKAEHENIEVVIVASDKDLYQLISEKVKVLHPKNYDLLDAEKIHQLIGVYPSQIPDYLALVGDKTDGIPGVAGIGEKTASSLLAQYNNLEEIYNNLDHITSPKIKNSLINNKNDAFLSLKLAQLQQSLPLEIKIDAFKPKEIDKTIITSLFKELQFYSLLGKFTESISQEILEYRIINDTAELSAMVNDMLANKSFSLYAEVLGDYNLSTALLGLSFCAKKQKAYYLPLMHDYLGAPSQIPAKDAFKILQPLLSSENGSKIIHDIKSFIKFLHFHGTDIKGSIYDPMILAHLINPSKYNYSSEELAKEYLLYRMVDKKELSKERSKKIPLTGVEINNFSRYACECADISFQLFPLLLEKIKEHNLLELYEQMELPLSFILADMEVAGIKVNPLLLKEQSLDLKNKLSALSDEIYSLTGEVFNINSPKQLSDILFKKLKLPATRKTKITRMLSTGTEVLEELATEHELARLLLDYRQFFKLQSTYLDALPQMINPATGRIHTIFNQTATSTGRLSSSNPNLQNIPIKTPVGKKVRDAFIAEGNNVLISADYSQIELRVLAHLSEDENLIAAFHNNLDIHALTASRIFGVPVSEVGYELRSRAKIINFGIIYGLSAYGLSKQIGCATDEAQIIINSYFKKYPKVEAYIQSLLEQVSIKGYVETLFQRRRYISDISRVKLHPTTSAERAAINMPVQGTAADIIKLAMIKLYHAIKQDNLKGRIVLQIHDELLIETPPEEIEIMKVLAKNTMEKIAELKVPLLIEIGTGKSWAEAAD